MLAWSDRASVARRQHCRRRLHSERRATTSPPRPTPLLLLLLPPPPPSPPPFSFFFTCACECTHIEHPLDNIDYHSLTLASNRPLCQTQSFLKTRSLLQLQILSFLLPVGRCVQAGANENSSVFYSLFNLHLLLMVKAVCLYLVVGLPAYPSSLPSLLSAFMLPS